MERSSCVLYCCREGVRDEGILDFDTELVTEWCYAELIKGSGSIIIDKVGPRP